MATAIRTYRLQEGLALFCLFLIILEILFLTYNKLPNFYLGLLLGLIIGLILLIILIRIIIIHDLKILNRLFADPKRAKRLRVSEKFTTGEIRDFGIKLEESLLNRQKRIETLTEQSYSTNVLLNNMREGIIVLDLDFNILLLNRATLQLLRVDPNSQTNTLQKVIRNSSLVESVKAAIDQQQGFELLISKHFNGNKSFLFRGSLLRDSDEKLMGILILIQDLSELEKLQNMRKDFVANVSHELRTPITAIKGYVETMLNNMGSKAMDYVSIDPATVEKFLGIIQKHVGRLEDLVEDILELSRIEKQEETGLVEYSEFRLEGFCQDVLERFSTQAASKDIIFQLIGFDSALVKTNYQLLDQAFSNLISNAIKYSPNGSQIRIEHFTLQGQVRLSVRDQGPGIDEMFHDRIFERFYRVDFGRTRDVGGTGLGLAIVKHAMGVIGGKVTLKSELGRGSCFTLSFEMPK